MKRIIITLSLKEKKAITVQAERLKMCRCTLIYKAMCLYKKQMRQKQQRRKLHDTFTTKTKTSFL